MRYLHLDVFTSRPLEGNQLAVFPDSADLVPERMQAIAREMNFSETTFILPSEGAGDIRMRIFTPVDELPIAGHPTIGSTFALAEEGVIAPGRDRFVWELGAGPTPVSLEWSGDRLEFAWMTQPLPRVAGTVEDRASLAAALGVAEGDLAPSPAEVLSNGVDFLFVPIRTRAAVDAVSVDRRALTRCFEGAGLPERPVFVFTSEGSGEETVYSRMLAPGFGIAEDPATGVASGPLGVYLLRHGLVTADQATAMVSLQGVAMGRPSRIHIAIESRNGEVTHVRVGGQAVLVGRGTLNAVACGSSLFAVFASRLALRYSLFARTRSE